MKWKQGHWSGYHCGLILVADARCDCEDGSWLVLSCGLLLSMPGTGKNPGCAFLPSCASWAAFPHRLRGAPGTNTFMKISASSSVTGQLWREGLRNHPHGRIFVQPRISKLN